MKLGESEIEGLTSLRRVDPVSADLTNAIVAVLNGQRLAQGENDDVTALKVAGLTGGTNPKEQWFSTTSGCFFRIVVANQKSVQLDPSRLTACVEALNEVDALLDFVEARLGINLEPVGLGPLNPDCALKFSIEALDGASGQDRAVRSHIFIAGQPDHFDATQLQLSSGSRALYMSSAPCSYRVTIRSAGLSVEDAANIDRGDLLLLEKRVLADITWPVGLDGGIAADPRPGWLNMETGHFGCEATSGNQMNDTSKFGSFSVPVTISLPPRTTSLDSLSSLQPGTSMPIGAITEGLIVDVSVGGRTIARGEIVQIGDRFAVHIEERVDMDDVLRSHPAVEGS